MHTDAHSTCNGQMIAVTVGDIFSPAMLLTPLEASYLKLQLTSAIKAADYAKQESIATMHEYQALERFEGDGGLYV